MNLQAPSINLRDCETVKCENCDGIYFREVILLKKISRFQYPSLSQDQDAPIPVYKCDSCGHVNKGANPFDEDEKKVTND